MRAHVRSIIGRVLISAIHFLKASKWSNFSLDPSGNAGIKISKDLRTCTLFKITNPLKAITTYLLHEENQNLSENLHEVDEKVERVSDKVPVSSATLQNDHLCIPDDEAAEKKEASPQVHLKIQNWNSHVIFSSIKLGIQK